jgi:hypothetical protein
MMPLKFRQTHEYAYHTFLSPLSDHKVAELLSFNLKDANIDYSSQNLLDICTFLDGSPINAKLAMIAIKTYGLDAFLADTSLLIEWKRRRAEDFLGRIPFSEIEQDVMSIISDYRFMTFGLFRTCINKDVQEITTALRKLEEFCCIERRGRLYAISPPIHDAASRDRRFKRSDEWKRRVGLKIVDTVSEYEGDESVPVALLEVAAAASIRSGETNKFVAQFVLPSYYVSLARDAYDDDRRRQAIEFCKKAYELKDRLSVEGRIEALRIWGLSAVRISDKEGVEFALRELATFAAKRIAKRHAHFIKGFAHRLQKRYDEAEKEYLKAYRLAPKNLSINRELADFISTSRRFC